MKDSGIILFGKKIVLSESGKITDLQAFSAAGEVAGEKSGGGGGDHDDGLMVEEKICLEESVNGEGAEKEFSPSSYRDSHTLFTPHGQLKEKNSEVEPQDKSSPVDSDDNPKTPSIGEDITPEKPLKTGTEGDTTNSQPKTPKKPEKILPCPRCDSMDTKFCYYNNCNVNQPRHFCKSCQRYWTAGGTMRNMPVGAGRRKRKNPATASSSSAAAAQIEVAADSDGLHNNVSFGSDLQVGAVSCRGRVNRDNCTSESVVTTSNSVAEKIQDKNGFFSQALSIPGAPWFYNPWSSAIPIPAVCHPGYPLMPIYPSPYWNCVPWLAIQNQRAQPPAQNLGKHSRDGEVIKPNGSEKEPKKQKNLVLIPKTLRIDDPAKSSIYAALGIKNENISRGLFKAFEAKGEEKKKHPAMTTSPVLQANPAALSRSLRFQEQA